MNERRETVLINGRPLSYRVRKSRRARKLGLQVSRREGVVITLPWRVGFKEVPGLLDQWGDWLDAKADLFDVRQGPRIRQFGTGSSVLVYGRPRSITIRALPSGRIRPIIDLADDTLVMKLAPGDVLDVRVPLEKYLRRLARADLPDRVAHWAGVVGHAPRKVIIGERVSRWGSCSARGTISLCFRLVMAPPEVIDAVVAHEVCHLVHLNHGPDFYSLLAGVCPDHRRIMDWLKEHQDDVIL